ncbi:MAG: TauD/TfdA family dioxygenase [Pseudomonadota bacterium]
MTRDPRYHAVTIEPNPSNRRLSIVWGDNHRSEFPYIWLRHERNFPLMGRPEQTDQSRYQLPENPNAIQLETVEVQASTALISWEGENSQTRHDLVWLRNHCLSEQARRERRPLPALWNQQKAAGFQWFDADSIADPECKLMIHQHLRDHGIVLINGLSDQPETLRRVAPCFGPIRNTHFGDLFDIRSRPDDQQGTGQNIGATASNAQSPHTDEGWRHGPPGISMMHCLCADPSGGGASIYVDGISAAEALREEDPAAFELLSTVPFTFCAERNPEERFISRSRVICTDSDQVVRGIRVTDRTLQPINLPPEQIEDAYTALGRFYALLLGPEYRLEHLLQPGEMVVFDNHRVLHARRAFNAAAGERWIQQLSVDREEFHSVFRQLAESLNRHDLANWEQDAGALSQPGVLS